MTELLTTLAALDFTGIVAGLLAIIGGAAILATMTPTPKDDAILAKIKKVLDFVAMNIGKAKNEDKDAE